MGQGTAPRAAQCAQQCFKCVWQAPAEPPASPRTSGPGLAATAASASSSSNTTRRGIAEESAGAARERPMSANGRVVVMTPGAGAVHGGAPTWTSVGGQTAVSAPRATLVLNLMSLAFCIPCTQTVEWGHMGGGGRRPTV